MSSDSLFALDTFTRARDALKEARASSIIEYTRPARVEPIVLLDDSLRHQPYLTDILQTLVSLFSGYYLQAISLSCNIGNVDILRLLEKMNPQRDPLDSAMLGGSRVAGWLAKESYENGQLPGLEQRNRKKGFDQLQDLYENPDEYQKSSRLKNRYQDGQQKIRINKKVLPKAQTGGRYRRPVVVSRNDKSYRKDAVIPKVTSHLSEEDVENLVNIAEGLGDDATSDDIVQVVSQVLDQDGQLSDQDGQLMANLTGKEYQQLLDSGLPPKDAVKLAIQNSFESEGHSSQNKRYVPGSGPNPKTEVRKLGEKLGVKRNDHGDETYAEYYKRVMMADGKTAEDAEKMFKEQYLPAQKRYMGWATQEPVPDRPIEDVVEDVVNKLVDPEQEATPEQIDSMLGHVLEHTIGVDAKDKEALTKQIAKDFEELKKGGASQDEAMKRAFKKNEDKVFRSVAQAEGKKLRKEKLLAPKDRQEPRTAKKKRMEYQYSPQAEVGFGDKTVAELSTNVNLSVGKMLEVRITSNNASAVIPVSVRLIVRPVPASGMAILLTQANKVTSARDRYHKWRSGELSLIKDIILCQDLIDDHKKALMADRDGVLRSMVGRGTKNRLSSLLSGDLSVANASSIIVVSKTVAKEIERRLNVRLSSFKHREELFRSTYTMLLMVVDVEWEQLVIYHRSIQDPTELSIREAKSAGKEGGSNIGDILSAYKLGTAPPL